MDTAARLLIAWLTSDGVFAANTCANPNRAARSPRMGFARVDMDTVDTKTEYLQARPRSQGGRVYTLHAIETQVGHSRQTSLNLTMREPGCPAYA